MGKFQHYLVVALRSLKKNRVSSALSLLGLSVAFAFSLISGMMIWDAYSSDGHWKNADNIYSANRLGITDLDFKMGLTFPEGGAADLIGLSPDIEGFTKIYWPWVKLVRDNTLIQQRVAILDDGFTDFFELVALSGNLSSTLSDPTRVAVSDTFAIEHFGYLDAVGESLTLLSNEVEETFYVGAVVKSPPKGSRLSLNDIYRSVKGDELATMLKTLRMWSNEFVIIRDGADIVALERQFDSVFQAKYPTPNYVKSVEYSFKKLKGARLSDFSNNYYKQRIIGLFGSTVFLLLVGILNYMSLSLAIAASRTREVALRKVLGASRMDLSLQVLLESLLLVSLAYGFALVIAESIVVPLSELVGDGFVLISSERWPELIAGWGMALMIGVLTAIYPIWTSLRGTISSALASGQRAVAGGGNKLRSLLLAMQSLCGLGLVFVALVIFFQIKTMETMDKGFDVDGLMYVTAPDYEYRKNNPTTVATLKNEFAKIEGVAKVTSSMMPPFTQGFGFGTIEHPETGERVNINIKYHSDNFIETMGFTLLEGRIPKALPKPEEGTPLVKRVSVTVNEAYVQKYTKFSVTEIFGKCIYQTYPENDVGEEIKICMDIAGVLANHHESAGEDPSPAIMYYPSYFGESTIILRANTGNIEKLLKDMNAEWRKILPFEEFKYEFVDEKVDAAYAKYRAMSFLLLFTAIGTMFLTIAGLYAMAKFVVARRAREIAIRRVLGARTSDIVRLVVTQLAKPIIVGALIGLPLGWYYAMDWLSAYTIRIEPEPWHAVVLGVVGIAFFLLSATGEILRAVRIRPAEALHYE